MVDNVDFPVLPRTVKHLFLRAQVAAQQRTDPREYWSFYNNFVDAHEAWEQAHAQREDATERENSVDESRQHWASWEALRSSASLLSALHRASKKAEREMQRYEQQLAEWQAFKLQPSSSETLSSLRRPVVSTPTSPSTSPSDAGLQALFPPLIHQLLSFLCDVDFFLRFPMLSHSCHHVFTHPDLHRQYGQQRFHLSDKQWELFSERAWPHLHLAVWKSAVLLEEATESRRWREAELALAEERRIGGDRSDHGLQLSNTAEQQCEEKTSVSSSSNVLTAPAMKDWALESLHLWLLLHYATLYLTRDVPNVAPTGERVVYRLPRVVRAILIDQFTSRQVCDILSGCRRAGYEYSTTLFPVDWKPLLSTQPSISSIFPSCPSFSSSSSSFLSSTSYPYSPSCRSASAALSYSSLRSLRPVGDANANMLLFCGHVIPHYGHLKEYNNRQHSHYLFVGPPLTRVLQRRFDLGSRLNEETATAAAVVGGVLEVELENAAVVETQDFGWSISHSERLLAANSQQWVQCGALATGLDYEEAVCLRDWLGLAPSTAMGNDSDGLSTLMERIRQTQAARAADTESEYQSDSDPGDEQPVPRRVYSLMHDIVLQSNLLSASQTTWRENRARRLRARQWAQPAQDTEEARWLWKEWARERKRRKRRRQELIRADNREREEEWAKEAGLSWKEWKAKEERSCDTRGQIEDDARSPLTKELKGDDAVACGEVQELASEARGAEMQQSSQPIKRTKTT